MKRIIAFIKPIMRDDVIFALHDIEGFPGARICEVQDTGGGSPDKSEPGDRTPFHAWPKLVRLEIVCPTERVEEIAETIRKQAHTGLAGDGKIYISAIEDTICIRSGERGPSAV